MVTTRLPGRNYQASPLWASEKVVGCGRSWWHYGKWEELALMEKMEGGWHYERWEERWHRGRLKRSKVALWEVGGRTLGVHGIDR